MKNEACLFPRNLNKPDFVIDKPFKMTLKHISYLALGAGGAYLTFKTAGLPLAWKIVVSSLSVGTSVIGAIYKHEGSTIDEIVLNSLTYTQRKIYYSKLEKGGDLIVTIGSKKEDPQPAISI